MWTGFWFQIICGGRPSKQTKPYLFCITTKNPVLGNLHGESSLNFQKNNQRSNTTIISIDWYYFWPTLILAGQYLYRIVPGRFCGRHNLLRCHCWRQTPAPGWGGPHPWTHASHQQVSTWAGIHTVATVFSFMLQLKDSQWRLAHFSMSSSEAETEEAVEAWLSRLSNMHLYQL
jgi:hypothetical protein